LLKGVTLKGKEKVPLNKITLITLEEKDITQITEMNKVPQLQNLYLGHNHIYRIEGL
jgi:Leucine-rich repeat (LRR) protein